VSNPVLEKSATGQPNGIALALRFQELVDLGRGEWGIGSEVSPFHQTAVAGDHRPQEWIRHELMRQISFLLRNPRSLVSRKNRSLVNEVANVNLKTPQREPK
jgi:hypothetical protein